jgi:hypothetical protein
MRTELIDWYKRHGYIDTGDREPFPVSDIHYFNRRAAWVCVEKKDRVIITDEVVNLNEVASNSLSL